MDKGKIVILDPKFTNSDKKENRSICLENTHDYYETNLWSYFIQEQLGETLNHYLEARDAPFTVKTTIQIGI